MINALAKKNDDLIVARWYPQNDENRGGKIIKVKIYTEWRKSMEQPVKNLMTPSDTLQLETKYNYDFKLYDKILFDGALWKITEISREYKKGKEKSLALSRVAYAEKYTRLSIIRKGGRQ